MSRDIALNIQDRAAGTSANAGAGKRYLEYSFGEWAMPLVFLLSMSMMGLKFPLGYILVPVLLINRFLKDRYDFLIMLTIFLGGYALISYEVIKVNSAYVVFVLSVVGLLVFRKNALIKKTVAALVIYGVALLFFAYLSDESLSRQIRTIIYYLSFVYFIVPLIVFSGQDFDIQVFFRKLFPYALILCAFYALDAFVVSGFIFIPRSYLPDGLESTFYDPIAVPFSTYFPRKYPPGLYMLALCVFPLVRYYKLRWWQWLLVLLAFAACRTFTIISGLFIGYILFQGKLGRFMKYALGGIAAFAILYFVDDAMTVGNVDSENSSFLRIKSSIDQLIDLESAQDDEDLAEAGTGRIGQAIPKFELLYSLNKQWVGLGFIDQETTNTKYIIENEYYENPDKSIEVATGIEIVPLQIILTIGYLGLMIHIALFVYLYYLTKPYRFSIYFLSVMFILVWFGLSGFEGLVTVQGLLLVSLAYSAVILENRREIGGFAMRRGPLT